jgi:hypothetical protein
MNTNTFCQSYIDLACQVLAISQKPAVIECEYQRLKLESRHYMDYLEKFDTFFDIYPSLKKELIANLPKLKVGAFIEYQLDLFHDDLKKVEELKTSIQKEITGLRNDFADDSKEWLSEEENKITNCFRYLNTGNIQQVISFLNDILTKLKSKKEFYLSEKQRSFDTSKEGERKAEEERKRLSIEEARKRGIKLSEQEIRERRQKAQDEYTKQMKIRKK